MGYVNPVLNALCDLLMTPFRTESAWPGMIAAACVTAVLFVWAFRGFSDQRALKKQKGRMLARALELLLFRHDMVVSVTAFPRIATANLGYLTNLLKPIAIAAIPSVLLLIQLAGWFEYRPFVVGEPVLVSADFASDFPILAADVELASSDGLETETAGLRIPALHQINWRLRARQADSQWVEITAARHPVRKSIAVDRRLLRVSDQRVRAGFWNELLHPGETPLPDDCSIKTIRVDYPHRQFHVAGWKIPWPVAFLVLVMLFGLLFGRAMNVSF